MSAGQGTEAVVIAATALRLPLPGNAPDEVVALVETGAGRSLVTLAVDPERRPRPGETISLGRDERRKEAVSPPPAAASGEQR